MKRNTLLYMALMASMIFTGCCSKQAQPEYYEPSYDNYAMMEDSYSAAGATSGINTRKAVTYGTTQAEPETIMETAAAAAYEADAGDTNAVYAEPEKQTGKKLIYMYNLDGETQNMSEAIQTVEKLVTDFGGYIENSSVYEPSKSDYYGRRNASYIIRIPAEKAHDFLEKAGDVINVISRNTSVEDITLSYTDTEAKKISLQTEEKRLLEILEKAETVEDLMAIEQRLSEVRYERESIERQLRTYDSQIDYSTINLSITEVKTYTEPEPESIPERVISGFKENFKAVTEGLVDFLIGLITHIPQLIVFGLVIVLLRKLYVLLRSKNIFKRKPKHKKGNETEQNDIDEKN